MPLVLLRWLAVIALELDDRPTLTHYPLRVMNRLAMVMTKLQSKHRASLKDAL